MEYYLAMTVSRGGEFPSGLGVRILGFHFPGGLGVRILGFHCCGQGSVRGQGTDSQAKNKQTERSGGLTLASIWMNLDNTEASH